MTLRHSRPLIILALTTTIALLAVLPALASSSTLRASTIGVTVKKSNDFRFLLSKTVVAHGVVTFKFANQGSLSHNFKLCSSNKGGTLNACAGKGTPTISGGGRATLKLTLKKPGRYEYLCTVPGHAAAGMKGLITVK
jgi:plastocyanin